MKVLVVEDSVIYRHLLCEQLREFEVVTVPDAESALPIIAANDEPFVLLMDWELPGMSGLDLIQQVRNLPRKHYIYAVMLTGRSDKSDLVSALAAGLDDYVVKPFHAQEFQARIQVAVRTLLLHEELVNANDRLELLASHDPLTGLANRRALNDLFARELQLARRTSFPITIVMCDVDEFKQVNDKLGHAEGDQVLRLVARWLKSASRGSDIVARTGGDEFVVVLSNTQAAGAAIFVERVQRCMRADERLLALQVPVTLSFGIAEMDLTLGEAAAISRADSALYAAKQGGRNRYQIAASGNTCECIR